MRSSIILVGGLVLGLACPAFAAPIFIADNSFESDDRTDNDPNGYGPITGWSGPGNIGTNTVNQPFNNGHTIPDGSLIAFVQGIGSISQTLSGLSQGHSYELSYYEDSRGNTGTASSVQVSLGGTIIVPAHDVASTATYDHVVVDFQYNGPSGSAVLEFENLQAATNGTNDNTALFDNIQLSTPEPSSIILGALGAVGLFVAARRRRVA